MARFSPDMRLTYHRAMIFTQSHLQPIQLVSCYQWRITRSGKQPCSLSAALGFKFSFSTLNYLTEFNERIGQSRCRVSTTAGVRSVGIAPLQFGAAAGLERENTISHEELGRYGIDEFDYADSMTSPQRSPISDDPETSPSNPVAKIKAEKGVAQKRKTPYEAGEKSKELIDDTKGTVVTEDNDNSEAQANDWCVYLILSNDKRKTYLGATANLTRRLRQHNGELAGGAKSTRAGRPWNLVCTVRGLSNRSEAGQLEWRLRNLSKAILEVDETLSEEVPANYQGLHVILRRWAALKKVHETRDDWKHMRVEWH